MCLFALLLLPELHLFDGQTKESQRDQQTRINGGCLASE
jgi:hypothetical protein